MEPLARSAGLAFAGEAKGGTILGQFIPKSPRSPRKPGSWVDEAMNHSNKSSSEICERPVRMAQVHRGEYPSWWAAIDSRPVTDCGISSSGRVSAASEWAELTAVDGCLEQFVLGSIPRAADQDWGLAAWAG
jgi:hypothetical protein